MATPAVGSNPIRKLVARLRNPSSSHVKPLSPNDNSLLHAQEPPDGYFALSRRLASKHMTQCLAAALPSKRSYPWSPPASGLDVGQRSLRLWNQAYDALRDDAACTGLVVAYEKTVSQELPSSFRVEGRGFNSAALGGWQNDERLGLLALVASSGLQRRRASKVSLADEAACRLLESARAAIEAVLPDYPAAVVAWSGFCTLTPLLLDPLMQHADMRSALVHVVARIPWYMALAHVASPSSWSLKAEYLRHHEEMHAELLRLYRAVLELEMNCVCAAASIWNMAAKNVIGWESLPDLLDGICRADARVMALVHQYCTPSVQRQLADFVALDPCRASSLSHDSVDS
ncbi:hypothetical protein CDD82_1762 [Ophiocordyceps australis]|uniref:NWD NACHT-NTPase N-terminal domain-containing protein n=1 Tax=Ophiocordyceps australis TaxID=1399860 RepID=A0A2C5ZK46_9HYPO|nr:hypothetical protein CDD82_1762 [Ophiocordyceps australis]